MVDLVAVSEAVALMAATGAVSGVSESAALGVVAQIRERVRRVFDGDARAVDALARVMQQPDDRGRVLELAAALTWYGERDGGFAAQLTEWASTYAPAGSVTQNVRTGRDAYTAGRDLTVNLRPETR
jgi:hypothetical protein